VFGAQDPAGVISDLRNGVEGAQASLSFFKWSMDWILPWHYFYIEILFLPCTIWSHLKLQIKYHINEQCFKQQLDISCQRRMMSD
jgi:hypothetical protein